MVPLDPHQPSTTPATVTWKPERINSASWEFFLSWNTKFSQGTMTSTLVLAQDYFFDIPQKLLGCRPLCRSPKKLIELISPTKYFLYGFSYQIMCRSFQKRWNHHAWAFFFPSTPPWSSKRTCSPKTHDNKQPIRKRTNKKKHGGFTWQLGGTWFTFFQGDNHHIIFP